MYNKIFYDDIYEEDKFRAKNIIKKLENKLKQLEVKLELNRTEEENENILSKKLIVKILKYQFNIY
jgi:hypothetical protein